ncbi:MAG TPA: hypothetical protein VLY04_12845 [Bryobacteraceae bacterium]|nr:hypothetical protein [Bryobacteraceae bacterium]
MRRLLKLAEVPLRVAAVIALAYLLWVFAERYAANRRLFARLEPAPPAPANAKFEATYGASAVKILQFYARDGVVTEDHSTLICYGVMNARSVRIEPPVEGVSVSFNRCVEVTPEHDTRYTLTAEGTDGRTASESFSVSVKPDPATRPRILSFQIVKHTVEKGRHIFTLAYSFENAREVSIDPPVFSTLEDSAPYGQFFVAPDKTTTYILTVTGKRGRKSSRPLTVEVPNG